MIKCSEFHQSLLQSLTAKHRGNQPQHRWQWDYQSASLKILLKTSAQQLSINTASPYFRLHLRFALGQATQQLFFRTACLSNYFWVYCRPQVFFVSPFWTKFLIYPPTVRSFSGKLSCHLKPAGVTVSKTQWLLFWISFYSPTLEVFLLYLQLFLTSFQHLGSSPEAPEISTHYISCSPTPQDIL